MPYLHCNKCHHEWEGSRKSRCDWCKSDGYILENETPLEKAIKHFCEWRAIHKIDKKEEDDE